MTAAPGIYHRAVALGLRLEPRGDRLAVSPANRCPPDFPGVLREHNRELLDWLETREVQLSPDCIPWLHVARQILAGEFDGADGTTVESLTIGLRAIPHRLCERALARLPANKGKPKPQPRHEPPR